METSEVVMNIKEGDVFDFRYKENVVGNIFDPYHCFDGILVARKRLNELWLIDTYWSDSENNRRFSLEKALHEGDIKFLCNINEMVGIKEYEKVYFNDEDIVELRIHSGYRTLLLIKKGTPRSQLKMIQSINKNIEDAKRRIRSAESEIERLEENMKKVTNGDTSIYI